MTKFRVKSKEQELYDLNDFRDRLKTVLDAVDEMAESDMGWLSRIVASRFHGAVVRLEVVKHHVDEQIMKLEQSS
jgi:hypothetical protein